MDMDVDMNTDMRSSLEEQDSLMHHIILPRVLPQSKSPYLYETEFVLLKQMVESVEILKEWIPLETVKLFRCLKTIHPKGTPQTVSTAINNLGPGDTFAMIVRFQHCGIMIHVPLTEKAGNIQNVIVATFPNLHPNEIYAHESDIEVIFFKIN